MPPPRFAHGFQNDVFISYAHVDNAKDPAGWRWVSQFADDLARRLEMVAGHTVRIWRDDRLQAADRLNPTIEAELQASAVLLPILSPAYFASEPCRREREYFVSVAGAAAAAGATKSRIVKVAKTPPLRRYPEELGDTLEHRFYKEEPNGAFKEFHLHERADIKTQYATAVDDVAQELSQLLTWLDGQRTQTNPRHTVFLAHGTGDVHTERNHLRRFLEQVGCAVLPSRQFPLEAEALERELRAAVEPSSLALFVLGGRYGWVPEMGNGRSFVHLQVDFAARWAAHVPRIIWIPPGLTACEPAQADFLETVRRDLPQQGFELVESTLQSLEAHLRDRLEPKRATRATVESPPGDYRLYLMVDRCDRDTARSLRQYLLASGVGVDWLPSSGEAGTIGQLHREWLLHDDAFLIFYGSSDETWVACQQLELRKATGLGRRTPPKTRILLAAPPSPDKEDLRLSRELVLDGLPPKEIKEALEAFLHELPAARGREAPHTPPAGAGA